MKKMIKTIITLFLICVILGVAGFLIYLNWMVNSRAGTDSAYKIFEVQNGEGAFQIAEHLKEKGLIKSDWVFALDAKIKSKPLKTGYYNLSSNMSMTEIFDKISSGDTSIVKITIPEGYRTEQIAQILNDKGIADYGEFVAGAKQYEGKLFPDTYFLPQKLPVADIIKMMTDDYDQRIKDLNVSIEDLIIASIVEREAVKDEERPLIAGIYKNRVAEGMKWEADPTVQYGKDDLELAKLTDKEKTDYHFWKPITLADYKTINSTYNTYLISGYPPGPICNPGIKSIEATLDYTHSNYLYFLQRDGKIYPAKTLEEHNRNRQTVLGVSTKNL